jgi:hypothetical protein
LGLLGKKLYSPIPIDSSGDVSFILEHIMNSGWRLVLSSGGHHHLKGSGA